MATLSEQRTDSLGDSRGYASGDTGSDRSLVFDDLLFHRPRRVGVRALVVLLAAAFVSLGVWATAAGAKRAAPIKRKASVFNRRMVYLHLFRER